MFVTGKRGVWELCTTRFVWTSNTVIKMKAWFSFLLFKVFSQPTGYPWHGGGRSQFDSDAFWKEVTLLLNTELVA